MSQSSSSLPAAPDDVLRAAGVTFRVHTHPPVRTAEDVRRETGLSVADSVKTLVFTADDDRVFLVAFPGLARLGYGRLARAVGVPRSRLRPAGEEVLRSLGMEPGGVSPVCGAPGVTVVFDAAVPGMGTVYCGSGRADRSLEVAAADLLRLAGDPLVADVADVADAPVGPGARTERPDKDEEPRPGARSPSSG
ncbi:aminoacyl-tRNA deacylase [Streptomyces longwoodensis]|uniref:aminoacyl-tRNA deacylase n=1 Tax=Streptomyces longwoodensis TaxID=68231 RepID=UPI0036FCD9C4